MPSGVTVRPAATADLDALLALYVQLSEDNHATDPVRAAAAFEALTAREGAALLVAELDGRIVGTLTLIVVPNLTHNAQPWAQVENMVVDTGVRRSGAGRLLIERALAIAAETGCYKVQLQSANQRHEAHRFYEVTGFAPSSVGFRRYLA